MTIIPWAKVPPHVGTCAVFIHPCSHSLSLPTYYRLTFLCGEKVAATATCYCHFCAHPYHYSFLSPPPPLSLPSLSYHLPLSPSAPPFSLLPASQEPGNAYSYLEPKEEPEMEDDSNYKELGDIETDDLIRFAYQIASGMVSYTYISHTCTCLVLL